MSEDVKEYEEESDGVVVAAFDDGEGSIPPGEEEFLTKTGDDLLESLLADREFGRKFMQQFLMQAIGGGAPQAQTQTVRGPANGWVDQWGNPVSWDEAAPGLSLYPASGQGWPQKKGWTKEDQARDGLTPFTNWDEELVNITANGIKYRLTVGVEVMVPKVVIHIYNECKAEKTAAARGETLYYADDKDENPGGRFVPRLQAAGGFDDLEVYVSIASTGRGVIPSDIAPRIARRANVHPSAIVDVSARV